MLRSIAVVVVLIAAHSAAAHPGGLDSSGCHNETETGGYHCHGDDGGGGGDGTLEAALAVWIVGCLTVAAIAGPVAVFCISYAVVQAMSDDGDGGGFGFGPDVRLRYDMWRTWLYALRST